MTQQGTPTSLALPVWSTWPPGAISLGNMACFCVSEKNTAWDAAAGLRKRSTPLLALATGLSWAQTLRARCFIKTKLPDQAWAILLNAYIVELQGSRSSITSLTYDSNLPRSTSLRWVRALIDDGSLISEPDPNDKRRVWCRLHFSVRKDIERYLDQLANSPRFQRGLKACSGREVGQPLQASKWACPEGVGADSSDNHGEVEVKDIAALDLEAGMLVNECDGGPMQQAMAALRDCNSARSSCGHRGGEASA